MIVRVTTASVTLLKADDFAGFEVLSDLPHPNLDRSLRAVRAGHVEGDHAWISIEWLRGVLPDASHPRLQDMVAYAESKGWIGSASDLRAHIVSN
jgi:hypothetical protein